MVHAIICLSKPIECTISRVNLNVNYELWVIRMHQCRFINCKKCTSSVGDVDNKKAMHGMEAESMWEISVSSVQYCYEPKTTLKKNKAC